VSAPRRPLQSAAGRLVGRPSENLPNQDHSRAAPLPGNLRIQVSAAILRLGRWKSACSSACTGRRRRRWVCRRRRRGAFRVRRAVWRGGAIDVAEERWWRRASAVLESAHFRGPLSRGGRANFLCDGRRFFFVLVAQLVGAGGRQLGMVVRRPKQLCLPTPSSWGGRRRGAGRKPSTDRPGPPHGTRPPHQARHPVHVTLRARRGLPSLRGDRVFATLRRSLTAATKDFFRIVHFSVQSDHVHLIVEGDGRTALIRGIQGLAIRCARAINRALARRGSVWWHRYHARALRTPRETRHGLVYVLLNFRKHLRAGPGVDPRSSGAWFDGWKQPVAAPLEACPVSRPRSWLAAGGWLRGGGRIDLREMPAPS
jgi:hypothetical protein